MAVGKSSYSLLRSVSGALSHCSLYSAYREPVQLAKTVVCRRSTNLGRLLYSHHAATGETQTRAASVRVARLKLAVIALEGLVKTHLKGVIDCIPKPYPAAPALYAPPLLNQTVIHRKADKLGTIAGIRFAE